ncbi:hypothetical protein TNCT_119751 [Trichonephila clavata]|uniref:Uncharacterized protein n=1 Tax=Trichonephila clavata TaxID=2740835 RepID=A0A8X6LUM0_TRICU|nr:hypothetical protein TNCT_119751 [Trichonephila clavata]
MILQLRFGLRSLDPLVKVISQRPSRRGILPLDQLHARQTALGWASLADHPLQNGKRTECVNTGGGIALIHLAHSYILSKKRP